MAQRKLIIIGNGFDLAHGMPTSYGDFFTYFLTESVENFCARYISLKDEIPKEERSKIFYQNKLIKIGLKDHAELSDKNICSNTENGKDWITYARKHWNYTITIEMSALFARFFNKNKYRWVDIENEYFDLLVDVSNNQAKIDKLHDDFCFLKEELLDYLSSIENDVFIDKLLLKMSEHDIGKSTQFCVLNFNYTFKIREYVIQLEELVKKIQPHTPVELINIHGALDEENMRIIFGIGDEYDIRYKDFKESKNFKSLLKYSKSQWYLRSDFYRNFSNFVEGATPEEFSTNWPFDVEIYGHSCGSSDRTLLRYIFEHPNCKSIKVYYHKNEEHYFDLMLDMEKIFTDPVLFRQKVVSLESCEIMPQSKVKEKPNNTILDFPQNTQID